MEKIIVVSACYIRVYVVLGWPNRHNSLFDKGLQRFVWWRCKKSGVGGRKYSPPCLYTYMKNKECKECKELLPISDYYSNGYTPNGTRKYKPSCKPCEQKKQLREHYAKCERALGELGKKYACEQCGYAEHKRVLDFHHVKPGKSNKLSDMITASYDRILKEVSLCQVLCANCHRLAHMNLEA